MIDLVDLKSVKILSNLSDAMLEKLKPITVLKKYKKDSYVLREGDYAEYLYTVVKGKVVLEIDVHAANPVRVKDIAEHKSFGISRRKPSLQRKPILNSRPPASVFVSARDQIASTLYETVRAGLPRDGVGWR